VIMRCIGLTCDGSESDSSFTRCLGVGLIERNDIKILSWVICEVYVKITIITISVLLVLQIGTFGLFFGRTFTSSKFDI